MRMHFPDMMASMDLKKESKRLDGIDRRVASKPSRQRVSAEPRRDPAEMTLDEAERLYESRTLTRPARLSKGACPDRQNPMHARVYYGLARIAALKRNPELAEQLFRKTLESSPDPHTRAWSEVYLGRLAQASTTPEQAVEHFKAALAVDGAPEKARQAAEEGLRKTSK